MSVFTNRTLRRSGVAIAAGTAALALALPGCSAQSAPEGAAAFEWELTDQTAAPSGDIDEITWASYSEPFSLV